MIQEKISFKASRFRYFLLRFRNVFAIFNIPQQHLSHLLKNWQFPLIFSHLSLSLWGNVWRQTKGQPRNNDPPWGWGTRGGVGFRSKAAVANPRPERELSLRIGNNLLIMGLNTPPHKPLWKMLKKTATLVGDGFPNIALIICHTHLLWKWGGEPVYLCPNSAVIDHVTQSFYSE